MPPIKVVLAAKILTKITATNAIKFSHFKKSNELADIVNAPSRFFSRVI